MWRSTSEAKSSQSLLKVLNVFGSWYDALPQPDRYALERFAWRKSGRREMVPDDSDDDDENA